jgi:hypothetical protein
MTTEREIRDELIKVSIESNQRERNLRSADAKKKFAITRCFSFTQHMCKADDMKPCRLQCYDLNVEIHNPKTKDERLVRK